MAQAVLGGLGGTLAGGFGQAVGRALGGVLERGLVAALGPARQKGPRLEALRLQATADGTPLALVLGRARVTGAVIWAARFTERRHDSGGGKGGPRTRSYSYSLSFAVAVCEGPIDGIGRIWADGRLMDRSGVTLRVHRGLEGQVPDPLIEAVEGVGAAPAYRGTAYVVFEDLALGDYGHRVPHLAFEVFRRPKGEGTALEERLEGVCLIPGAGEFVLATEAVIRRTGLTHTEAENINAGEGRADLTVSLDQLTAACPNLKRVSLVVGWFGDDLRAGHCRVRPGVERRDKPTAPLVWKVAGLGRAEAHLVSRVDGRPAYGGTPSDDSVRQAVAELKARGLEVTLYPFVFMDIAADNGLPDPHGGVQQAAYPWRGRIVAETPATAQADVAALFGGADDWGLRRMARHYAALAAETGADGLLIGSEMRGLTTSRDSDGAYPAVQAFREVLAECRAMVGPGVKLSYAADWSEYAGHRPDDGSGDVIFHLDPLWSDAALDYVGIDWYPPMGDWRAADGGLDAAAYEGPDDPAYLAMQMAGGEGYDWFYAGDADRAAQTRTPITDTAHGEDWVFRIKDLKGWWGHVHHDRPGGVRAGLATAWVPGMKPVRLTEFGCAAVDRGGNAPNLFQDPKSAENALPPYSTGVRDERMQRRVLEAVLTHFEDGEANPVSGVYGGHMLEAADVWCWDARPWPAFPARDDLWADASGWARGHWLNGRLTGETAGLLAELVGRVGGDEPPPHVGPVTDRIEGYVIDRPMSLREALAPLAGGLGLVVSETGGRVELKAEGDGAVLELDPDALVLPEDGQPMVEERTADVPVGRLRLRYLNVTDDYQTGAVTLTRDDVAEAGDVVSDLDVDVPIVCDESQARHMTRRLLETHEGLEQRVIHLGPLMALKLEAGDRVRLQGESRVWRVERMGLDETSRAWLVPERVIERTEDEARWNRPGPSGPPGAPWFRLMELPELPGRAAQVVAAVSVEPWSRHGVTAGPDEWTQMVRATVAHPARVGRLLEPLGAGPCGRWDENSVLIVHVEGRAPESRSVSAVLNGANVLAVETADGWELIQFRDATLVAGQVWRLSGLLRGQGGGEPEVLAGALDGAAVVFLDEGPEPVVVSRDEWGLPLLWRAGVEAALPSGGFVTAREERLVGRAQRPWMPVHLETIAVEGGLGLQWVARLRQGGDGWDGEAMPVDPMRFRVRILQDGAERRAWEVDGTATVYAEEDRVADLGSAGPGEGAQQVRFGVSQASVDGGWGPEAQAPLCEGAAMS